MTSERAAEAGEVEYGDLPRLSAAATPGPWELLTSSDWGNAGFRVPGSTQTFGVGSGQVIGEGLICGPYMDFHGEVSNFGANAEFIVAAVNAVRAALAAARGEPPEPGPNQLQAKLTRHHRHDHVTATTCRVCQP